MKWLKKLMGCFCGGEQKKKDEREPTYYEKALEAEKELRPIVNELNGVVDRQHRVFSVYGHRGENLRVTREDYRRAGLKYGQDNIAGDHDIVLLVHINGSHGEGLCEGLVRYLDNALENNAEQVMKWVRDEAKKDLNSKLKLGEDEARKILRGGRSGPRG